MVPVIALAIWDRLAKVLLRVHHHARFRTALGGSNTEVCPVRMDESAPRGKTNEQGRIVSFGLRGRLESERTPLIRPGHRQVDET
jgi:hypothetical protein